MFFTLNILFLSDFPMCSMVNSFQCGGELPTLREEIVTFSWLLLQVEFGITEAIHASDWPRVEILIPQRHYFEHHFWYLLR
jgi:hypothetical protein